MTYHDHFPQVDLTTEELLSLLDLRGGCRCQDPNGAPPCGACSTPLNWAECEDLGIDPLRDKPKPPVDYMKAVRDLCK